MASTAIPFIFPATSVEEAYFMDGSVRQIAPLSPAADAMARRDELAALLAGESTSYLPFPPREFNRGNRMFSCALPVIWQRCN
jgi:predicted acylesterase/phospholipase RssA